MMFLDKNRLIGKMDELEKYLREFEEYLPKMKRIILTAV